IWYALIGAQGRAYQEKAESLAQNSNASLTYYRYKVSLDQAGAAHLPKKEIKPQASPTAIQPEGRLSAKGLLKGFFGR
ncbi:MAG: hypothetical protein GX098_08440, partial [Bacteroidales bacterium]|nr:hypothetical protein [Bacteroidales bacterium]